MNPFRTPAEMPKEPVMPDVKTEAVPFYFNAKKRGAAVIAATAAASIVTGFMADLVPDLVFKTFPIFTVMTSAVVALSALGAIVYGCCMLIDGDDWEAK